MKIVETQHFLHETMYVMEREGEEGSFVLTLFDEGDSFLMYHECGKGSAVRVQRQDAKDCLSALGLEILSYSREDPYTIVGEVRP